MMLCPVYTHTPLVPRARFYLGLALYGWRFSQDHSARLPCGAASWTPARGCLDSPGLAGIRPAHMPFACLSPSCLSCWLYYPFTSLGEELRTPPWHLCLPHTPSHLQEYLAILSSVCIKSQRALTPPVTTALAQGSVSSCLDCCDGLLAGVVLHTPSSLPHPGLTGPFPFSLSLSFLFHNMDLLVYLVTILFVIFMVSSH